MGYLKKYRGLSCKNIFVESRWQRQWCNRFSFYSHRTFNGKGRVVEKRTRVKIDNVKEFRTNEKWLEENNEHIEKSSKQCMLACKNNEHWSKMKSEWKSIHVWIYRNKGMKIEKNVRESQWIRAKNNRQCQAHTHLAKGKILQYHTTIQDQ